jgi:hypothetical protein
MADRYWVGGSGTWDTTSTTNWSASTGGASGASAPTAADNVFFDAASASGNYTVAITDSSTCANISVARATAGTLGVTGGALLISGGWTSVATGVTWSASITFNATSGSYTVTTGGLSFGAVVQFNGAGGTWQLQDNLTTVSTLALWGGTLDINGKIVTCNFATVSSATTRVLALGTGGTIVCPNTTGGFVWNGGDATGFSYTGTGSVNFTYSGAVGTRTITHGSTAGGSEATKAPPFNLSAGSDSVQITGSIGDLNTTGFNGTFNGGLRTIYGNLTIGSGTTTQSSASATTFGATSGTKTITTNGRAMNFPISFSGVGGTFQLADNYSGGTTSTQGMTLAGGTLDLNGKTLTTFGYTSTGTAVRGITANSGQINITGNGASVWGGNIITNVTMTGLTVNFTYNGSAGTRTIAFGSSTEATAISANITAGTDTVTITGSVNNLNFTGFTGTLATATRTVYGSLTLQSGMFVSPTVNATTFLGSNSLKTITTNGVIWNTSMTFGATCNYQLQDNVDLATGSLNGTALALTGGTLDINGKTVTALSFNSNSATARVLALGTNGVINVTASGITVWQASTATNFSYTGTGSVNFTYSGGTGTRTISHGSSSGGSAATKPPPFFITAGTDIVATTINSSLNSIDFTGFTGTLTNTTRSLYGNLTLGTGMTATGGANSTVFASTTSVMTLISNGVTTDFSIAMNAVGGIFQLTEPLVISARTLSLISGTIDCNDFDATVGIFSSTGSVAKTLDISNTTFTLASTGTVWSSAAASNITVNYSNSTTVLTDNSAAFKFLALNDGLTLGNVVIGGNTSTGQTQILPAAGANVTIESLSSTRTVNQDIYFGEGTTTTINNWGIVGTSSANVFLGSNGTSQFNLVYGGVGNVSVDYHTISKSNASPSNTWYALFTNNNSNGGNNTGWIFSDTPVASPSNFFLVF